MAIKKMNTEAQNFEDLVDFHGSLGWYVGDCYPEETQKALKKLKATTYSVRIGNSTVHYFSNEVPKEKDFADGFYGAPKVDENFWKELRAYVKSQKLFIKNPEASKAINKLKRKSI